MRKLVDTVEEGHEEGQNICPQSVAGVTASTRWTPAEVRGQYVANIYADTESLSLSTVERGVRVSNPWDLSSRIESVESTPVRISSIPGQRSSLPKWVVIQFMCASL